MARKFFASMYFTFISYESSHCSCFEVGGRGGKLILWRRDRPLLVFMNRDILKNWSVNHH